MLQKPNRMLAFLSYLLPFVGSIVAIATDRKNAYALYHACQALAMYLAAVLLPIAWLVVAWLAAWVPLAGATFSIASFALVIVGYVTLALLWLSGLANVLRSEQLKQLFIVGKWGEKIFARLYPIS
jgi:uncharacterized membrane protein